MSLWRVLSKSLNLDYLVGYKSTVVSTTSTKYIFNYKPESIFFNSSTPLIVGDNYPLMITLHLVILTVKKMS